MFDTRHKPRVVSFKTKTHKWRLCIGNHWGMMIITFGTIRHQYLGVKVFT
jgi:hypothetical protein